MKRAAITGIGVISPFGRGRQALCAAPLAGRTALFARDEFPGGHSALVSDFGSWRRPGRARLLAAEAARSAIAEARLTTGALERTGLVLGTIVGEAGSGMASQRPRISDRRGQTLERAWSWAGLTARVAKRLGLGGCVIPVSTACASGADALGLGAQEVWSGRARVVVAGGVEVLAPFQWEGFRRLGALDPDGLHPFDRDRQGTGMGEGACFWVIEEECSARERGAKIFGRIRGWATSTDGHSLVAPEPRGRGLRDAARRALAAARVGPGELSLILAHGTGTPANDKAEAQALLDLLGPDAGGVPVTGIKGATGHCLGASAAMEATACLSFIRSGRAPPVVGLRTLDSELGITPVHGESREITGFLGLALSAGFGGQNAALVLEGVK